MASFLAAGMQTAAWISVEMEEAAFSSRLARTRATKHDERLHMQKRRISLRTAVAACARAV
jgi:hypothetical protein